jgi:hypothetical protein
VYGHRALAAAVLIRAIKDGHGAIDGGVVGRQKRIEVRRDARAFLKHENEVFQLMCDCIDLDPVALSEAIKTRGANTARSAFRIKE